MADELEMLASKVREKLERGEGNSLAGILRDLGVSPENQERLRGLLSGLGYGPSQLSDVAQMAKIAEGFLSSMPSEARKQLACMVSQVVVDMNGGNLPPEVAGFLSTLGGENSAGASGDKA
ncbi:MAG: hypothetical protein AB1700_18785 [Bacillota bacterium]